MYLYKFLQYNDLEKSVLSEDETLENIMDLVLDGTPNKEEKKALITSEDWSKYAYQNEKEYHLTVYLNDKLYCYIDNSTMDINIDFLTYNQGEIFKHLTLVYDKYNMDIAFEEDRYEKFQDDALFLSQINNYYEDDEKKVTNKLIFKLDGSANILSTTFDKKNKKTSTEAKKTKANVSHNFISPPKNYIDYEKLIDYKNILKPEYLDL
ncbi:hypothetical protein [Chryseobacterium caseinilyticum]|uniref:Uncharacterized protein n=1 Tax=Chryseobacterium caseinilyticum TaxID=2771428 RepID=A0ABR8ZB19_9FLAO|nr:hypothetical protein [Chryseobacterium caseinilyticum]MBD8082519.1 hypothetical protein [Chryseobacterium caseinilyticum]